MNGGKLMKKTSEKQTPLISVITPAYNAEDFIAETIDSVLNQTYEHWEMIIIDDCSTDGTVEKINTYTDDRITLIELKKNSGSGIARNRGIDAANGRFIAFLDSDDLWLPEKLENQLSFMMQHKVAFSFTEYARMKEDGSLLKSNIRAPETINYHGLLKHCVIGCLTVMIDMDKTGHIQMVDLRARQDYVLWLTLTKKGYLAYGIPKELAIYRIVRNSISSNKFKMAKRNWKVYRHIEGQGFFKSIWYLVHYACHYTGRLFPRSRNNKNNMTM